MAVQLDTSLQGRNVIHRFVHPTPEHIGASSAGEDGTTTPWAMRNPARPFSALPSSSSEKKRHQHVRRVIATGFALNIVVMLLMLLQARSMILELQLRNQSLAHQLDDQSAMIANGVEPLTENKMTALAAQVRTSRQDDYILTLQEVLRHQNVMLVQNSEELAQKTVDLGQKTVDIRNRDAAIEAHIVQVTQKEGALAAQSARLSDLQEQMDATTSDRDAKKQALEKEQSKTTLLQEEKEQLTSRVDEVAKQNSQLRRLIGVDDLRPFNAETALASGGMGGSYGPAVGDTATGTWDVIVGTVVARQKGNADLIQRLQLLLRNLNPEEQTFLRREWLRKHGTDPNRTDIWPTFGGITQRFGATSWNFEGPAMFQGRHYDHFHTGLDISTSVGTPVHVTADGVVVFAGRDSSESNTVLVRHAGGYETLYVHNSRLFVQAGERVSKAQTVALSGDSGHSTGPHVHYEVRHNGELLDPFSTVIDK